MSTTVPGGPSRRQLLLGAAGALTTVALWSGCTGTAFAAPGPVGSRRWTRAASSNGWPVTDAVATVTVEGTTCTVDLVPGDVAVVLLHVIRRWSYEIRALVPGDVTGHRTDRALAVDYESSYLSGTGVAVRAGEYPVGVAGGLFPGERLVVDDILAECGGVVAWGGSAAVPKESHFAVAVRSGDPALAALAATIRGWSTAHGEGAGTIDAAAAPRRARARTFTPVTPR